MLRWLPEINEEEKVVVIKSYQGGISLHISDNQSFEEILSEVATKFEESRKFFRNASVALSVEGRTLDLDEEKLMIQTIEAHSDLQISCLVGKNEETNRKFIKALKRVDLQKEENNGRFFRGDVLPDQLVESEGNLVIIGNVLKGGTVAATKDIIVLGELEGEALAGLNNEPGHFITAVKMSAESCRIGSLTYRASSKGLFDKRKSEPCIIYEGQKGLVCEIISPEIIANVTSV